MSPSRRDLLRASALLAASGAAGCASFGGSNVSYPATTADGSGRTTTDRATPAGGTTTADPTTEATTTETTEPTETTTESTTTTAVPESNAALAADTARVFEGVVWFATAYSDAVRDYQDAVDRVLGVVGQLRRASDVDENDLRRLESSVAALATVVRNRLQPRFPGLDGRLADPENAYVRTVRRFARRGDWDRTRTELDRMHGFYLGKSTDGYVEDAFSASPIHGALLDYLTADDAPGPALFEVGYPPRRYGAFAYAGEDRHPRDDPLGAPERNDLGALFAAVDVEAGRRDYVYANPAVLPNSFRYRSTERLRSFPVHVQRFVDDRAAANAVVSILDGPAVQEGTERLAGTEWRRLYFYHEGDIVYAYLARAGPFLVTTGTSETAWEEREEAWSAPLERSWLWNG